jgi:uncharacterized protein (TIGR02246 family)
MKSKTSLFCALLVSVLTTASARAEDLRATMEAINARWLQAYNGNHPEVFLDLYAKDAVLLAPESKPITGREAIAGHWAGETKTGRMKDRTFEIVSVEQDDKLAYQVNHFTVAYVTDKGQRESLSGSSVRIFERQPDGGWLIKVHIDNLEQ